MHDKWYMEEGEETGVSLNAGCWVPISDELPKRGAYVPLLLLDKQYDRRYWIQAMFVDDDELELSDDCDIFQGCTTMEDGTIMCPAGWYECSENDEVIRPVKDVPIAWLDLRFPSKDGKGMSTLNERVPAVFDDRRINEHFLLPWKVLEHEYELWDGSKMVERTIATSWIQGQLKSEMQVISQAAGAKDKQLKLHLDRDNAEFIVTAVNSYYNMRKDNRMLKHIVQLLLDGDPNAVKMAERIGLRKSD
jgi:hypothetical protein